MEQNLKPEDNLISEQDPTSEQDHTSEQDWEFVYDGPTNEFPMGYYLHIPSQAKYCFNRGIVDMVGEKMETNIYNMWWLNNG